MTPKNILILLAAAVVLGGAYLLLNHQKSKTGAHADVGKNILANVDLDETARIEINAGGRTLEILRDGDTWRVPSLANYPADFDRIVQRLRGLADVTISDVLGGMTLDATTTLALSDASGKNLVTLHIGQARQKSGGGAMMWQPPEGRYLRVNDSENILLVKEDLSDLTSAEPRSWVDTQLLAIPAADIHSIAIEHPVATNNAAFVRDEGKLSMAGLAENETFDAAKSYGLESAFARLSFANVLPADTPDETTGLSTGVLFRVTLNNDVRLTARLGAVASDGSRHAQFSADVQFVMSDDAETPPDHKALQDIADDYNARLAPYVFTLPSYLADNMIRPRDSFIKPAEHTGLVSEPIFIEGETTADDEAIEAVEAVEAVEDEPPPDVEPENAGDAEAAGE